MDGKQIARRFLVEAFAEGRVELLDTLLADGYVDHDMPKENPEGNGIAGVRFMIATFRSAFPDLTFEIEEQIEERDLVATRCRMTGTNTGSFFGMPPTGSRVDLPALCLYRTAGDRIAEAWVQYDNALLRKQLTPSLAAHS